MRPRFHPTTLLLSLLALGLLAACGDDGGAGEGATGTIETNETVAATDSGAAEVPAAPGRILVSSTGITGHEGHALLVFGPNNGSELCATIDGDPWTLEAATLTDRSADSDPCTGTMNDALFEPGGHGVTASIFAPGSRTALVSTAAVVELVDGDAHLQLDGSRLSGTATGDPGSIIVEISEITGHAGRILIVLGQNNGGSLCASIDGDSWAMPTPRALTELPGGDGGPCGEGTPAVLFPPGDTRITAAVVIPGNPSAEATIDTVVRVDGDVTVTIDGSRLSQ